MSDGKTLPERRAVIDRIRELFIEAGGKPLYPVNYRCNRYHFKEEVVSLLFDYGHPVELCAPEGGYSPIGSAVGCDRREFMRLLEEAFETRVIRPQGDDSKTPYLQYQLDYSGPLIELGRMKPKAGAQAPPH